MKYPTETKDNDDDNNSTTNNNSFIIHDNSSEIARTRVFPDHFVEPLVILAKIKGYTGIDDYVIHLIEYELETIKDGGRGIEILVNMLLNILRK